MNYLVAGLGNIGDEYANTRHNMGFMVLDAWAQASNAVFKSGRYGSTCEIDFKGRKFTLLKPSTYMNLSGNAVRYWLQKLPVTTDRLMVICDDINLPFGTLRLRASGSDGGHNGLKNINEPIQTQDYARLRMGVGHEFSRGGQIDFVLSDLDEEQQAMMSELTGTVISGVQSWIFAGINCAMSEINGKKLQKK